MLKDDRISIRRYCIDTDMDQYLTSVTCNCAACGD